MTRSQLEDLLPKKKAYPTGHIQPTCNCRECVRIDEQRSTIDDCLSALEGKVGVVPSEDELKIIARTILNRRFSGYDNDGCASWRINRNSFGGTIENEILEEFATAIRALMLKGE